MAKGRDIYNLNPDRVEQFKAKIAGWGTRDLTGLPLGDVLGHSLNRLAVCYGALSAAKLAAAYGRTDARSAIESHFNFTPVAAIPQDWRGRRDYPAAHLAPCSLRVGDPAAAKPGAPLFNVFADGVTRSYVGWLFARTELVHVLVNRADSRCEGTPKAGKPPEKPGLAQVLTRGCDLLISNPYATPREIMYDVVMPGFRTVIAERLTDFTLESQKLQDDIFEESTGLVDAQGRPFDWDPERADFSIHSESPEALKANRRALANVLETYVSTREPRSEDIALSDEHFRALRSNEEREARTRLRAP
jgi:hypothetical protein